MNNLVTRTISGIVFLAVIIASLLWRAEAFGLVFLFITLTMMTEYIRISVKKIRCIPYLLTLLCGAALFTVSFCVFGYEADTRWFLSVIIVLILIITSTLIGHDSDYYRILPFLMTPILYIAVPFSLCCIAVFDNGDFNALPLLAILIMLWCSDVGAYVFGMTLRRFFSKKLCPSISPKKTVIGYIGSLVSSLTAGYILSETGMLQCSILHALIISFIVNVTGTIGDLAESQFKRHFDVKDSGRIMPGHGGLLDRFDGALLAFPASISYILISNCL
ncbi:MAG: phosphatidate cytidylyltransferase [Alistipes sp.]|nr:phosphatidate cytidylyltransferase [Candidatus Minthomonas equi]